MMPGNGQLSVPPGFRFHPTDEELLYYYLRKKVSYEVIDLDVIREVDLNKLEPWDLKEKCRIGTGPQNEWYFFSHKDKKYPTGTRTNRATTAGFWKATGRDKAIHLITNSKRIGMRKTLVFYTGRAPHGQKTDWIMHEYRLDDQDQDFNNANANAPAAPEVQEDGWVVCRVFKKKNHNRVSPFQPGDEDHIQINEDHHHHNQFGLDDTCMSKQLGLPLDLDDPKQNNNNIMVQHLRMQAPQIQWSSNNYNCTSTGTTATLFDASMHLPQLMTSPHDQSLLHPLSTTFLSPPGAGGAGHVDVNNNNSTNSRSCSCINMNINDNMQDCSRNLLSLINSAAAGHGCGCGGTATAGILMHPQPQDKSTNFTGNAAAIADWSFLDKLLASHHHHQDKSNNQLQPSSSQPLIHNDHDASMGMDPSSHRFPFQYQLGYESDILKFSK